MVASQIHKMSEKMRKERGEMAEKGGSKFMQQHKLIKKRVDWLITISIIV